MVAESARRIIKDELAEAWRVNEASEPHAEANDATGYLVHDREFHTALFEPAQMPRAMQIVRGLWQTGERYRVVCRRCRIASSFPLSSTV